MSYYHTMKRNLCYLQSGGPTAVINSSLYGAYIEAKEHEEIGAFLGSRYGIEGLLKDDLIDMGKERENEIALLPQTPGAILGTTRKKMPEDLSDPLYDDLLETIERHNIGYLFVNGGNDSMDTCSRLHRLFAHHGVDCRVLGIPKTVDNDLLGTDHSLGYPSAAKHVMNTVKEAVIDASCYPHGKLVLLEIMGRNAGWLTAASDLLPYPYRPDLFFLPENPFDEERFLKVISDTYWKKGYAVAALSEGVQLPRPKKKVDAFGHSSLEGVAVTLANLIEEKTKIPTRTMELSLPQRADPINVARIDREEAIELSRYAVREILKGESGKMVCIRRLSNEPYKVEYFTSDVHVVANGERKVPREMLVDETRMADSFRKYLAPLVKGEVEVAYEDGTFKAARFSYVKAE